MNKIDIWDDLQGMALINKAIFLKNDCFGDVSRVIITMRNVDLLLTYGTKKNVQNGRT